MKKFLLIVAILALIQCVGYSQLSAQGMKPADYYRGKTVTIVIPSTAGNQHDLYARVAAPYLSKATGAHFVVIDEPGGRGIKADNELYFAKPDGLKMNWYNIVPSILNYLFDNKAAKYKFGKFTFVAGLNREPNVFLVKPGGPYQSLEDLKAVKNGKFGSVSRLGNYTLSSVTVAYLLDLDVVVVSGMNPNGVAMAMNQGEIIGGCFSASNGRVYADRGLVQALYVVDFKKHPSFPDTPAIGEVLDLKGEKRELLELWSEKLTSTSTIYMAPGTPEDKLAYMRDVFTDLLNNPEFISEVKKIAGYSSITKVTGKELAERANGLVKNKKNIQSQFESLLEKYVK